MKETMKEKYKKTNVKLQPCCDMFIQFGYHTHFLFIPLWYTFMCINCGKKIRGWTLAKTIQKWNSKITHQND